MELEFNIFLLLQKIVDKINYGDFINDLENYKNFYIRNKNKNDIKIEGIPSIFMSHKCRTATSINGKRVNINSTMEFESGYFTIRVQSDTNLTIVIEFKEQNKRITLDINFIEKTFSIYSGYGFYEEDFIYQNRSLNDNLDIVESMLITDGTSKLKISKKNMEILTNALR